MAAAPVWAEALAGSAAEASAADTSAADTSTAGVAGSPAGSTAASAGLVLFETGAIVLYIGERSEALLPKNAEARARATQWLIAALNSIEPHVMNVAVIDLFYQNEEWAKLRRPSAVQFVQRRLSALSKSLGDKPYLDGDHFTAGDLIMTTVLRILKHTDIVTSDKRLAAYIDRCTARPAFKRAFDAQIGDFKEAA